MNNILLAFNTVRKVIKIIRFHIVVGGGLAYSIGTLLAVLETKGFSPILVALGYLVVLFGDLSTHYSNDYFDVDVDNYIRRKKFFAGKSVLVNNPRLRPLSKSISIALMMLSIGVAGITVLYYGVPMEFLMIAISANLVGWFYSAPPLRLTSRGCGEIVIAIITGLVIPSAGYLVVRGQFDPLFIFLTIPFVMYGLMLSLSLEAPDIEVDRMRERMNLVVRKGTRFIVYTVLLLTSFATIMFLIYALRIPSTTIDLRMIVLFSMIPLMVGLFGFYKIFQNKLDVNHLSTLNVTSLFAFNLLLNGYCIYLTLYN